MYMFDLGANTNPDMQNGIKSYLGSSVGLETLCWWCNGNSGKDLKRVYKIQFPSVKLRQLSNDVQNQNLPRIHEQEPTRQHIRELYRAEELFELDADSEVCLTTIPRPHPFRQGVSPPYAYTLL